MKRVYWFGIVVLSLVTLALASSRGIAPRLSANKYSAHAEENGAAIGVTRLSASQLRKGFELDKITASDLDESSVIVEVGLYPARGGKLDISPDAFVLRPRAQTDAAIQPSSPQVVVAGLPYWVQVDQGGSASGAMIAPRPTVGSDTGVIYHDPVTGMPRREAGATRPSGTDVGVGAGGSNPPEPATSPERRNLQLRMEEKALPQGETVTSVAGYIYFRVEHAKDSKYELEYTLNGKKIVLPL